MSRPRRRTAGRLAVALALTLACSRPTRTEKGEPPPEAGRGDAAASKESTMQEIEFEAVVREFKPNAMRDTYDDGSFAVFHLTRLEITAPPAHAGKTVAVYNDGDVPADSPWRRIGAAVQFRAAPRDIIDVDGQVFAGAVRDFALRADRGDGP